MDYKFEDVFQELAVVPILDYHVAIAEKTIIFTRVLRKVLKA